MEASRSYHIADGPTLRIAVPEALQHRALEVILLPADEALIAEEPAATYATAYTPLLSPAEIQQYMREVQAELSHQSPEEIAARLRNWPSGDISNFGDPVEWQRDMRQDRELPLHILDGK